MALLIITTILWAFSFSLFGEYLAGHVDSYFAVLVRVGLAALVFLAALARALHVLQPGNAKTLCATGLAAFALGLCWQLPQCFALLAGNGMGLAVMPDFFAGLGLCCVGSIGGVCAAACLNRQS